jgi:hypothetical protein
VLGLLDREREEARPLSGDHPAESRRGKAPPTQKPLDRDQALNAFKLYEDKGWAVKQQMLASVGWLTPVIFALIAYYFTTKDASKTTAIVTVWTAFSLSFFMAFLTVISLMHANKDYERSHEVVKHVGKNKLLPDDIFKVILGEKDNYEILLQEKTNGQLKFWRRFWRRLWRRLRLFWLKHFPHFRYIGWQFNAIMSFAVVLVVVSFVIASWATFF